MRKFIPLFSELYPKKTAAEILALLKLMVKKEHYQLLVAYQDKEPIGLAGLTPEILLYSGKTLRISNLYVQEASRKLGVAALLIKEAEAIAKKHAAQKLVLDSYLTNKKSQQFYLKENFTIETNHFVKNL